MKCLCSYLVNNDIMHLSRINLFNIKNMKEIYVIVKFKLNSLDLKDEWKKLSDFISGDMKENAEGLIFRDSIIDKGGNVQCILRWDSKESQEKFELKLGEMMKEQPEIMENFAKIADMSTMTKEFFDVV